MEDAELQVATNLDRFFSDAEAWQQVAEVAASARLAGRWIGVPPSGSSTFRVRVPKPYPGVQFRKSKTLEDRYRRYARDGITITGRLEDGGDWLRLSSHVFLPVKVGSVTILEELPDCRPMGRSSSSTSLEEMCGSKGWWACGPSKQAESCGDDANIGAVTATDQPQRVDYAVHGDGWVEPKVTGFAECDVRTASSIENLAGIELRGKLDLELRGKLGINEGHKYANKWPSPVRRLPEAIYRDPLSNLDAANRHLNDRINPFSDTPPGEGRIRHFSDRPQGAHTTRRSSEKL